MQRDEANVMMIHMSGCGPDFAMYGNAQNTKPFQIIQERERSKCTFGVEQSHSSVLCHIHSLFRAIQSAEGFYESLNPHVNPSRN